MGVTVEVKDKGWNFIQREIKKLQKSVTLVGLFGGGGDPGDNIAARGAVQEFGSKRWKDSRGRPFMRQAFDSNKSDIEKAVAKEYDRILKQKSTARRMLRRVGVLHEGQIKQEITSGSFRPLAESTIRAKGSSRPLIDTGQMRGAIQHKEQIRR